MWRPLLFGLWISGMIGWDGKAFLGHDAQRIGGRAGAGSKLIIEVQRAFFDGFLEVGIPDLPVSTRQSCEFQIMG